MVRRIPVIYEESASFVLCLRLVISDRGRGIGVG